MRRQLALAGLTLISALAGGGYWLSQTESGWQRLAGFAAQASAGRLQIGASHGSLSGPLHIEKLSWESPELKLQIIDLQLDWRPSALFSGQLAINTLRIGELHLSPTDSSEQRPPPTDLRLPLTVNAENVAISSFAWAGIFSAQDISGQFTSDGQQHRLSQFVARSGEIKLSGDVTLGAAAPLPLEFSALLEGKLESLGEHRPLRLSFNGKGPLERIALAIKAEEGIKGQGQATITPFAAQTYADAQLDLSNINPADWQAGAPSALLTLKASLQPAGNGVAGDFSISNQQAGALDRQRLPLEQLSGQLNGDHLAMNFEQLRATLSGGGTLNGQGQWQNSALSLNLQAAKINAAALASQLRKTQLAGPLAAQISIARQSIQTQLSDPRFALKVEASHADGQITLPKLELSAGDSQLNASGELNLNRAMAFKLTGGLTRFDPSRFIKSPAALINSRFTGEGKLSPQPQINAHFDIADSQLGGEPLAGQGDIRLLWPHVQQADVTLNLGKNQLHANGAYGQPGNVLEIVIKAPELAPYGIDGGLDAQLRLGGTAQAPALSASAEAARLRLPGIGQINGLTLKAEAGGAPDSPLQLNLTVASIDLPDQPDWLQALHLEASGSNAQHTIHGHGQLSEQIKWALRLQGGLNTTRWHGEVQEASITGAQQSARLSAPAALDLAADNWSLGPANITGGDSVNQWQMTLQGNSDGKKLHGEMQASGPRMAVLNGQIDAEMRNAWGLNELAPWQVSVNSRIDDLAWVAALMGERWKSGGQLNGELKILGTPAHPLTSGRIQGENLVLQFPEQGLSLARGELDIDLRDNLLHVNKFNFDSLLQKPPRTLLRSDRIDIAKLVEQPGRLEISGEMRVDRNKFGDRAALDIRLERFGAYQRSDAWVLVSGTGRLSLANETLSMHGKLAADAGYWQLADSSTPRLSDDVVIKSAHGEKDDKAAPGRLRPKLDVDLSTNFGRNFYFSGAGLSSRLVGDIRLRASGRDLPRATGSIRSRDGRFEAYGQQLNIERGILTFQGLIDNPALDVRAVRSGLPVEAGVQVGGTAQRPTVKLISDPDLPDAEKLSWLVLGHGSEQMGAGDAALLLSAAGSILGRDSGGIVKQLKSTFGIDEFGVRQGQLGDNGSRTQGSRVAGGSIDTTAATGNQILSVGKRLSSNAMLSYEQALGEAESIVKLTVNLTREISIIGRAGSDNALDIFYTLTLGRTKREARRP
ncbi:MAG: translocation/assembly module TamB domain-containing protein, partial [Rhodocyclaceae bacterium]|nr:translocation/assembly module TamB domain-containing protein [Rhodocyclaceae bacterium]